MDYEITDVLSFLEGLSKQRENDEDEAAGMVLLIKQLGAERKQAFDKEAHRVNRDAYGAGAKAGMLSTADVDDERERLNVQYWTETVPMVADYNKEHGTDIKPWSCVLHGNFSITSHPYFDGDIKPWRIAVAIVYDEATGTHKPVHIGDPIWIKGSPHQVNWVLFHAWKSLIHSLSKDWTWTPYAPKREFEINGEKFACPEKGVTAGEGYKLQALGVVVSFKNRADRDRVRNAIRALLIDARNK